MNGFTRMLMGFFWIGCAIYGYNVVNPNYNTVQVVACGFLIGMLVLVGVGLLINGVEKMQRGE